MAGVHVVPHGSSRRLPAQRLDRRGEGCRPVRGDEGSRGVLARRGVAVRGREPWRQLRHLPGPGGGRRRRKARGGVGTRGLPVAVPGRSADRLRLRPRRVPAGLREDDRGPGGDTDLQRDRVRHVALLGSRGGPYRLHPPLGGGGRFVVFTGAPDGSDTRAVASAPDGDCEDPSFAPDGRSLVYTFRKRGYSALKIISSDGRSQRTLVSGLGDAGSPAWS